MSETQGGGEGFPPVPPPQPQPYGQFPAAPPYAYQPARPERPATVRLAAFAWWGAVLCWFLGALLSQLLGGHVAGSFRFTSSRSVRLDDGTVLTQSTQSLLPTPVAAVAFLILGGLWALLVYGVFRGANWARILLAVLGALGIANVSLQLIAALDAPGQNTGDILQVLFFIGVLVLSIFGYVRMFRAEASPYFVRRR
ncbi:hypothetical protein ACIRSS_12170 [Amycolatopsis sp. NPDC101161]|uniref:hypothetical protein n=1 Tax=Amycolatopsis sp. NPDC101161 TaxID=3363940 RepID=UPI003811175E